MKKRMLKIISLLLLATLTIGMGGCTMFMSDKEICERQMAKHLEDKYGKFEYEGYGAISESWIYPYDQQSYYIVLPDGTKDEFWVHRYREDNGEYRFEDTYYWCLIRDEYEAEIKNTLEPFFSDCKVFYPSQKDPFSNEITDPSLWRELFESNQMPRHITWVLVDENLFGSVENFVALEESILSVWPHSDFELRIFLARHDGYVSANRNNLHDTSNNYLIAEISTVDGIRGEIL